MLKDFLTLTLPVFITLLTGIQPSSPTKSQPNAPTTTTPTSPTTTSTASYFKSNGTIDAAAYLAYASAWDSATVSQRLGPTFEQVHPNATDTRPTNFKPDSLPCAISFS